MIDEYIVLLQLQTLLTENSFEMKPIFQHHSTILKLVEYLVLILLCTFCAFVLWRFVCHDASLQSLRWLQFLQDIGIFILPAILGAMLWSNHPFQWLGLTRAIDWKTVIYAVLLMLVAFPAVNLLLWCNQQLVLPDFLAPLEAWMARKEQEAALLTERFLQADNLSQMFLNVALMALLPAVAEELTFRGTLQKLLSSNHIAIWVTAVLFSAIHLQFYGFLPRLLLGALFGYLYLWSGSLYLPILAHFTHNTLAVVAYYITQKTSIEPQWFDTIGTGSTLWLGLFSALLLVGGIVFLRRYLLSRRK